MGAGTRVSRVMVAPRERIYQTVLDPDLLAQWRVPDNMTARVDEFDAREGGKYRMTLTYEQADGTAAGKTTANTDSFRGRYVRLVPEEEIVEKIEFESSDPRFANEMTMTTNLRSTQGGCEVTILCENLPDGIRPEDNELGCRMALEKLARLVEA